VDEEVAVKRAAVVAKNKNCSISLNFTKINNDLKNPLLGFFLWIIKMFVHHLL